MAVPSGNEQPPMITSPDGKLQILHHRMSANRFGHRVVEGAVRNISSDAGVSAEIKVEYYDADGTLIGSEVDTVRRLGPGKTGAFEVVHSGPQRPNIKYYKIANLGQV